MTCWRNTASAADKLPYDAERDFTFIAIIAIIATSPSLLVAHPGLKVRTIQGCGSRHHRCHRRTLRSHDRGSGRSAAAYTGRSADTSGRHRRQPPAILPYVPTFAGSGLPGVNPESFRFLVAPAGLPAALQSALWKATGTVIGAQDLRARLAENGFDPTSLTGAEARAFVMKELQKWRQAVKDSGAKAN